MLDVQNKKMVKKSELRSEFERIVTTKKFFGPTNSIPIKDFRIVITSVGHRSFQISLQALCDSVIYVGREYVHSESWCSVARSFPMRSYKSAYQTLVRL